MNGNRKYRSMDFRSACGNGTCVEVALGELVLVRDSKDPEGPVLVFTTAEWEEFLRGVKAGMFDIG
jgi:hypothetical protein